MKEKKYPLTETGMLLIVLLACIPDSIRKILIGDKVEDEWSDNFGYIPWDMEVSE